MSFATNRYQGREYKYYNCGSYKEYGKHGNCTSHYIRYKYLYSYVLARIQHWCRQVQQNEEQTLEHLLKAGDKERAAAAKKQTSDLKKAEKRRAEVDRAFVKLYEDWAAERITEYNLACSLRSTRQNRKSLKRRSRP